MKLFMNTLRRLAALRLGALVLIAAVAMPATVQAGVAGHLQADAPLQIDFDWVGTVPQEVRKPVEDALAANLGLVPTPRLTATAFRSVGDWAKLILVPTAVVASGWEMDPGNDDILQVFSQRENGQWQAFLGHAESFEAVQRQVPTALYDFSAPESHGLRFPWTAGMQWRVGSLGWHQGNAIDFSPVVASDDAVLAAEGGTVELVCGGPGTNDPDQAMWRITHHDGERTGYLHLAVSSIDTSIDGQSIPRGWRLGDLYDGNAQTANNCPSGWTCQFATPCGYGTGPHLHFTISDQSATVDGNNINTVGNSGGTAYLSTNVRVHPCGPPNAGNWTIGTSCIMTGVDTAPANVTVQNGATLTLFPAARLNIDFVNRRLQIQNGSRVRIIAGGRVY
jgi:murein DD-endopeptidase MepM/ murein hydrolase activator NlpD